MSDKTVEILGGTDPEKSGQFLKDPRHHRATYGVAYPTSETTFEKKVDLLQVSSKEGERKKVDAKKIHWKLSGATVTDLVFRECNFHTTHGREETVISSLTFENCDFNSCFLGFVRFRRTTFRKCTFNKCEMSRTEFEECTLDACKFILCTPWEAVFHRTLIDPPELLKGFHLPAENLREVVEEERNKIEERRLRSCVALAEQILRSNEERGNANYCDSALFQSRRAALRWRWNERKSMAWTQRIRDWPSFALSLAHLHLTHGGTSLKSLIAIAAVICFLIAWVLNSGVYGITVRGIPAGALSYWECMSAAGSLFFAFGFTNLAASGGVGNAIITVPPMLGMAWSAIVLAVVVRRVYR